MGVTRALLWPAALAAGWLTMRQAKAFLRSLDWTRRVQEDLLAELLRRHADTAFGRDHGFAKLRTYADFATAVPIRPYEALQPYVRRVLAGETTALVPPGEPVLMFSMTSGTTGEPKFIPVTPRFLRDIRLGWSIWGRIAYEDHPEAWLRPIVQISSSMRETVSHAGVPCGAISGLLAVTQRRIVRRMYCVPPGVAALRDPVAKYYAVLRFSVGRDVCFVTTANPSSTIKLIETGQAHADRLIRDVADGTFRLPSGEMPGALASARFRPHRRLAARLEEGIRRDGRLLPRHFWNLSFLANWTGGTLKLYLPRLRDLFGDTPVRDIGLLASEGRFSIPLRESTSAGVADIHASFLEFIPAEERDRGDPRTFRADEVRAGQEYFLVVSNWAGLWRYALDDRVRVVDRMGQCPVFEFLCRGRQTASITGEKITEQQVVEAMRRAGGDSGGTVDRFVLQGRFGATPYYELRLEASPRRNAARLAEAMDAALSELNVEYASKRSGGRLGAVRPVLLAPGAMDAEEARRVAERRGRDEQYKHQYLRTEVLPEAEAVPARPAE